MDTATAVQIVGTVTVSPTVPVGGGVTWGAIQTVAMSGASVTFVPANALRKALLVWNPVAGVQANYDIAGGAVTAAKGKPLLPGNADAFEGTATPVGIVTAIAASGNLYYQEGT